MINQDKVKIDNSGYNGIAIIYLVTIAIALVIIMPAEEVWYLGVFKASVWPLYMITAIL